jgi:hypothetical protein
VPFDILRRGSGLRLAMTINIDARSGNGPYAPKYAGFKVNRKQDF